MFHSNLVPSSAKPKWRWRHYPPQKT